MYIYMYIYMYIPKCLHHTQIITQCVNFCLYDTLYNYSIRWHTTLPYMIIWEDNNYCVKYTVYMTL